VARAAEPSAVARSVSLLNTGMFMPVLDAGGKRNPGGDLASISLAEKASIPLPILGNAFAVPARAMFLD
jgi:hypothetical protein